MQQVLQTFYNNCDFFDQIPPIKAFVGGFDKASIVKPGAKADEAYKADIRQVGNIMKQMLDSCGYAEDYEQVSDRAMCFACLPTFLPTPLT